MGRVKKVFYSLLFPKTAIVILSVPVSAGLLLYTFLVAGEESPLAYISYIVSAYSLTIVCTNLVPVVKKGKRWVRQNPYISRYLEDIPFKLRVSLNLSLGVNLLYAIVNALSGIYYHSVWFGTLAAYYIFLAVMRFLLVRYAHKNGFGENRAAEQKRYRACGIILIMMNLTLAGVVILVLHQNQGFEYAGFLIYLMALYTFYITVMAVINVVRYRKYHSPVMSAAKAINLAAALVSMLSLETAMLSQFDDGSTGPYFCQIMIGFSGGAVCAIVVGMGVYMLIQSTRQLRKENVRAKGRR